MNEVLVVAAVVSHNQSRDDEDVDGDCSDDADAAISIGDHN